MKLMNVFKRVLVVLVICMFVSGMAFSKEKPTVRKGTEVKVVSGTLVQWKDLKKIDFTKQSELRKWKPIMNFENPRKIVKKTNDHKLDPVAQTSTAKQGKGLDKGALTVTPGTSYAGMNLSANGAGWPPDPNGDVGPTYFIQTVNTSIGIYNKSTGALVSATTFDAFFPSAVGAPCDNDNNGDPIVLYDRINQRWFILDFAWTGSGGGASYFSIAASQTSNPTGAWYTYCFQADSSLMNDYPKCGVWRDGIYITANMFQWTGSFQYVKVWALRTPQLYQGTLTSCAVTNSGSQAFSLMPTNDKGSTSAPSGSPNFMFAMDADEFGGGAQDALYMWKAAVNWSGPSITLTGPQQVLTAAFGLTGSGVPQQGSSISLDSLYGRLMNPGNYWNFGTHESVVLSHVCEYSSRRAMRWYEVRIDNSDNFSIYQQGTYSPDSNHRWMGSVAINANGDIGMGYSVSSSTMYPAIRVTGRTTSDTLGTMQTEASMVSGSGSQTSYNRWGDYSSCFVDPTDNTTFWYTQEYYTSTGTNWQTRFGSFTVSGGGTPTCTLNDAVDNATITLSSADWACDQTVYCYGGDAAKSGTITHSQSSSMAFTRTFSGTECVQFQWKVSSESGYDYLRVYVDGVDQGGGISGDVACTTKTIGPLSAGSHTVTWTYSKDGSVSNGSDAGWVDQVQIVTCGGGCSDPIAVALDDASCSTYTNTGSYLWSVTTSDSHYGGSSMVAPTALGDNQSSTIQTTISGFTSITFWWKVSSEANYDYLSFYIDSVRQDRISGTVGWQQKSYTISSGSHTIKWVYSKDGSVSSGSDVGWVDHVTYGTGGTITYCASSGSNQNYEWISRVQVANINNSSGASGYSDFTSITGNLTRGSSASVTLTPTFAGSSYTEYWSIWIDYNQNGVFTDSGEQVFTGSGSSAVSGSFTPPGTALTGNTRMRVTMKYGGSPTSCESFTYGEVEDYTVNIQ